MAITAIFLVLAALTWLLLLILVGQRAKSLPPGPQTLPIIGNFHQIPKMGAHYRCAHLPSSKRSVLTEAGQTHQMDPYVRQHILSQKLGPSTAVVITDRRLVKQLLDKKGNMYSNPP
jgi:hypothetical protein